MKITIVVILLLISALLFSDNLSIYGDVTDKDTHQPLIGASVTLLNINMEIITGVIAGADGSYSINNIDPGSYNLRVSRIGHETIIKNRVVIKSNIPTNLDIALSEQYIQMEGVTVRGNLFEKPEDVAVSSRSMDFEEIIAQPGGAYDIQRAVQSLPAVVSGSDGNNEIIVRGGNYGENLFVLENIEIPNPNHFGWQGMGGGPVNIINTDFVKHIDFIAGAFPARYGDKASSVMSIQLREGMKDRLHGKFDLNMAGVGGSIEGPISNGNFMISAHRSFLSLIANSFGLTAIPNYWNVQGKFTYNISWWQKFSIIALYAEDWIVFDTSATEEFMEDLNLVDYRSDQYTIGANLKNLIGDKGYLNFTLARTMSYWNQFVNDSIDDEVNHHYSNEGEYSFKCDLSYSFVKNLKLSFGFAVKNVDYYFDSWGKDDTLFIYDSLGNIIDTTDYIHGFRNLKDGDSWKYNGYIQLKHDFGIFLTAIAGIRYDRFEYTNKEYLSPRASLSFHILNSTDLNIAYGKHFQTPQWYELVYDSANKALLNKYTEQIVVGIDHLFSEDIRLTVEAYYKEYRDVPIARALTTLDPNDWDLVNINQGKGYSKGIEFFLQKKVMTNFWGTLSYSYSVAKAEDPRYEGREYSWDFDYGNVLTTILGYRKEYRGIKWYDNFSESLLYKFIAFIPLVPSDESEYTIKYKYIGGQPYTPLSYHWEWRKWITEENQEINGSRIEPYQRLDFLISNKWYFNNFSIKAYIQVENLLNNKNIASYLYTDDGDIETIYQMGRMVVGGFTLEF